MADEEMNDTNDDTTEEVKNDEGVKTDTIATKDARDGDGDGGNGDGDEGASDDGKAEAKDGDSKDESTDDKSGSEDEGKGEDEGGSDEGAPETYAEFNLPEGIQLDGERLEAAQEFFKKNDWSQEKAQEAVEWFAGQELARVQAAEVQREETVNEWRESVRSDSDIGGANLDKTTASCGRALRAHDPEGEFVGLLEATELGDHPAVVRFLRAVGSGIREDSGGGRSGAPEGNPLHKIYTTMSED